jgi:hypothetical protein
MRTVSRFGALALPLVMLFGGWSLGRTDARDAVEIVPGVEVSADIPEQLELARWAVGRFEMAGLDTPTVEIAFHADRSGCRGHIGFALEGEVDVCTTLVNAMTRRALLHEMSHIWLDQNVTGSMRARFLSLRGLASWNAATDPWRLRGCEQGAEIISWAIGERIITAQIPDNVPTELEFAFDLLTRNSVPS